MSGATFGGSSSLYRLVISARERFIRAGIPPDQAAIDAEVLARHAAGWDRATYLARRDEPVSAETATTFEQWARRREGREPVAYIVGMREFWGLPFLVTPAVLIPRPETEFIVDAALSRLADRGRSWRMADVGTGSGCLAIALAHERPNAAVVGTDVSPDALALAAENARRLGVAKRVSFVQSSLLEQVNGPFDLIVSNPPYVPLSHERTLSPDVRDHEPRVALYGRGSDGLDLTRALLAQAASRLAPDGLLMVEFGFGQADAMREILSRAPGLSLVEVLEDLQGHERTVVARAT